MVIDGESKTIELANGGFALVSPEDYDRVNARTWYASVNQRTGCTYVCSNKSTEEGLGLIYLHRFVWGEIPDGYEIDHRNRDALDCRRGNLRLATRSQNNINRVMPQGLFGSGYRGVCITPAGRYRVSMRVNGRITSFGVYATAEEAARVYDENAKKYHGEFAVLNFVEE